MWLPILHLRAPATATDFRTDAALLSIAQAVTATVEPDITAVASSARGEPKIEPVAWLQCSLVREVLPIALEEVNRQWFDVIQIICPSGTLVY